MKSPPSRAPRTRCPGLFARLAIMAITGSLILPGSVALARNLSVDDILKGEGMGAVTFAPDGDRIFIERHRPYSTVGQEVRPFLNDRDRSELLIAQDGMVKPAFDQQPGTGYWLGSLSPSGEKAAIFRIDEDKVELGILAADSRTLQVLDVAPQLLPFTLAPLWISEDELLVVEVGPGDTPMLALDEAGSVRAHPIVKRGSETPDRAPVTVLHSGRMGENRPESTGALVALRADGTARAVLAEGPFMQVSLSPDGRHAAAVREAAYLKPEPGKPLAHVVPQLRDIVLIDLETRTARTLCAGCDTGQLVPDWSPDGSRLMIFDFGRTPARAEGLYELTLSGAVRRLAEQVVIDGAWAPKMMKAAGASYASTGLYVVGRLPGAPEGRDDWFWQEPDRQPVNLTGFLAEPARMLAATLGDGQALLVGDNALWRIGHGIQPRCIFSAEGVLELVDETDAYGAPIIPHAPNVVTLREIGDNGSRRLHFVDVATGAVRSTSLAAKAAVLKVSNAGAQAVVMSPDGEVGIARADGRVQRLTSINTHLKDITPPEIHKLKRKDRNGAEVVDWLVLPAKRQPGPMPLVVNVYPGSVQRPTESGYERPRTNVTYGPHLLLQHGYAILHPSVPLKQGIPGEPLADTGAEVSLALDRAIETGLVDPKRMVLHGHSFGGYGTAAVLATERRFKAAMAFAGPMNLASAYGQFDVRQQSDMRGALMMFGASLNEDGQIAMAAPPWADPERYVRNSPVFQAHRIETPLLIVHGDMDYVSLKQAEEMFTALYRQGKDATLLRYWGEGHYFSRPRTIIDLDRRIPLWLNERLGTD